MGWGGRRRGGGLGGGDPGVRAEARGWRGEGGVGEKVPCEEGGVEGDAAVYEGEWEAHIGWHGC